MSGLETDVLDKLGHILILKKGLSLESWENADSKYIFSFRPGVMVFEKNEPGSFSSVFNDLESTRFGFLGHL